MRILPDSSIPDWAVRHVDPKGANQAHAPVFIFLPEPTFQLSKGIQTEDSVGDLAIELRDMECPALTNDIVIVLHMCGIGQEDITAVIIAIEVKTGEDFAVGCHEGPSGQGLITRQEDHIAHIRAQRVGKRLSIVCPIGRRIEVGIGVRTHRIGLDLQVQAGNPERINVFKASLKAIFVAPGAWPKCPVPPIEIVQRNLAISLEALQEIDFPGQAQHGIVWRAKALFNAPVKDNWVQILQFKTTYAAGKRRGVGHGFENAHGKPMLGPVKQLVDNSKFLGMGAV